MKKEMIDLVNSARLASKLAHTHVSDYKVGAVLLTAFGQKYIGYNIESDLHTMCIHAEILAVLNFLQRDDPIDKPKVLCVYTKDKEPWYPCGLCRQYIWEKCGDILIVACNDKDTETKYSKLSLILPNAFERKENVRSKN